MASFVLCRNHSNYELLCHHVRNLSRLIEAYRWLIDAYVSDFYTFGHWDRLPKSVQHYFDEVSPPEFVWILDSEGHNTHNCQLKRVLPLSLIALQSCVQNLSLKRTAVDLSCEKTVNDIHSVFQAQDNVLPEKSENHKRVTDTLSGKPDVQVQEKKTDIFCSKPEAQEEVTAEGTALHSSTICSKAFQAPKYKNGQCMDMKHIFRKHVKPKKQHEINNLGQVVKLLADLSSCENVVDVGAGLGHLSRLLSFQHGLRVTTIEAADGHAPKAAALDREMKKDISKAHLKRKMTSQDYADIGKHRVGEESTYKGSRSVVYPGDLSVASGLKPDDQPCTRVRENAELEDDDELPSHLSCLIQPDIAASQFLEIVKKRTKKNDGSEKSGTDFVLAGLHACGDLTPTLLRVFTECPSARGLASVACCYMKVSTGSGDTQDQCGSKCYLENYPMSQFLVNLPHHNLSYEAREMACHFADAYRERLKNNPPHLKIHSYRAALQYLLMQVKPDFCSGQARFVSKKGAQGSFRQYAEDNLKKVDIDFSTISEDILQHCEELTLQWKRVVAFYTLRLSLAPAVETLLLLDRVLFLHEKGIRSSLVPIFDASISPRNFALLALKT